jgi:hypothetical protein
MSFPPFLTPPLKSNPGVLRGRYSERSIVDSIDRNGVGPGALLATPFGHEAAVSQEWFFGGVVVGANDRASFIVDFGASRDAADGRNAQAFINIDIFVPTPGVNIGLAVISVADPSDPGVPDDAADFQLFAVAATVPPPFGPWRWFGTADLITIEQRGEIP